MQVQQKESMIKFKETEKGNLKASIEVAKVDHEKDFSKLRRQLDEQAQLI